MSRFVGHITCDRTCALCERSWLKAEAMATQMLERFVERLGHWPPTPAIFQRVHDRDTDHYVRVTITIDDSDDARMQ